MKDKDDTWEADLLILDKFSRQNDGFKYILNVIDQLSKYTWCKPLKNKTGKSVAEAFEEIILKSKRKPKNLHVDEGKEFINDTFKTMLKKYNINMYHTQNKEIKAAIVERFNRTLNQKLKVHFEVQKNFRWIDILPKILEEYNNRDFHRTIGMTSSEVDEDNIHDILTKINKPNCNTTTKPKFKKGDRVRIYAYKRGFENKYKNNWTREIFIIDNVFYTIPITYSIRAEDDEKIEGRFYKEELQKTKF